VPHPFPDLLSFDENDEPTLDLSGGQPSLEQSRQHDHWQRHACPHGDRLIEKRLGNVSMIWHVQALVALRPAGDLKTIREKVIYSDSHSGDRISASDAPHLLNEARKLLTEPTDPLLAGFAQDMIDLAEASLATGNPIVF
jgi:hypothetical protein